jgi:phage host-nuclease inhibitor protein Gam
MTDIDIDRRFDRLQDAADVQKRIGAQYAKRLDALEAEMKVLREAMTTLIETAPTPAGESPHG